MFNIRKNKTLSLQYKKRKFPNTNSNVPGDQEGLFKLAIQLRKFLFITM
jgi:hypothetical protein